MNPEIVEVVRAVKLANDLLSHARAIAPGAGLDTHSSDSQDWGRFSSPGLRSIDPPRSRPEWRRIPADVNIDDAATIRRWLVWNDNGNGEWPDEMALDDAQRALVEAWRDELDELDAHGAVRALRRTSAPWKVHPRHVNHDAIGPEHVGLWAVSWCDGDGNRFVSFDETFQGATVRRTRGVC